MLRSNLVEVYVVWWIHPNNIIPPTRILRLSSITLLFISIHPTVILLFISIHPTVTLLFISLSASTVLPSIPAPYPSISFVAVLLFSTSQNPASIHMAWPSGPSSGRSIAKTIVDVVWRKRRLCVCWGWRMKDGGCRRFRCVAKRGSELLVDGEI